MPETVENIKDASELASRLAEVLATWPLYRVFRYAGQGLHFTQQRASYGILPTLISIHCGVCKHPQLWETHDQTVNLPAREAIREYECRNCRKSAFIYALRWLKQDGGGVFVKFGQWPALSHMPPSELKGNLNEDDVDFYGKALDCRNFSYGLGALAYMRRVIENRINDILDLAYSAAKAEQPEPPDLTELEAAKASRQFSDKLALAKKLIPRRLQPEGIDPIGELHDSASAGMHGLSEDQCIKIFDRGRLTFEHIFAELKHEELKTKQYLDELRALHAQKSRR
jgi:hypothetical protein